MKKNNLHFLLQKLNSREIAQLQIFMESSFFNQREDLISTLNFLTNSKNHPFLPEKLWSEVFPNRKFQTTQYHLLISRTFKLAEDFLACREMMNDLPQKKKYVAKAYRKLKLEKHFQKTIKDTRAVLEKNNSRNADFLRHEYDLEHEFYDYIASPNRKEKTNLQNLSDSLDDYFIASKLKQGCMKISRETINQEFYEIGLLKEVIEQIEQYPEKLEIPAIAVHYYCYLAVSGKEFAFEKLLETMNQFAHCFHSREMRDIYFLAINYCIKKLNTGDPKFIRLAFELYKSSLEQGFILEDGEIPESTFSNVTALGISLSEFEWVEKFILNYQQFLNKKFRESVSKFSLAKLFYAQNQYEKSMKLLAQTETKAPFIMLGIKTLQLKIFYELKEWEALDSLLESLKVYISRRKDLGYRKENYQTLIRFSKRLMDLEYSKHEVKEQLKMDVENAPIFTEKKWFLEQLVK